MCLSIPKQVTSVKNALVKVKSKARGIEELATLIKVKKGDWILSQNRTIIKKITQTQAKEISALFQKGGRKK